MKGLLSKNIIDSNIFKIILFILFLIVVYDNYHLLRSKNDIQAKEMTITVFKDNLYISEQYEGKKIWNVWDDEKTIRTIIKKYVNDKKHLLLVYLKNISCFACLNFHLNNLKQFDETPVLFLSSKNSAKLVKSYLPNAITITDVFNEISLTKKIKNLDMMIFFIDGNGRILFVTKANKNNIRLNKVFYEIINRFI